ncbi:MAG TPA: deoxyribodipyrimidine photo-lyase, partial [Saprospiraceae bacterium]|nr:deoxyribodipyrimidine photo-lyase [Saprospiraceae bacterium]
MVGIKKISICWFRRDLRLQDQTAFYHALKSGFPVLPIFIFDTEILNKLENKKDSRVTFLYDTIGHLKKELNALGSDME